MASRNGCYSERKARDTGRWIQVKVVTVTWVYMMFILGQNCRIFEHMLHMGPRGFHLRCERGESTKQLLVERVAGRSCHGVNTRQGGEIHRALDVSRAMSTLGALGRTREICCMCR